MKSAIVVRAPASRPAHQEHGLTLAQFAFCLSYLENGGNATQAYLDSHAGCAYATAMSEGQRSTRNPKIARYLSSRVDAIMRPMQMGGDEALMRTGRIATFNVLVLFDDAGNLRPMREWPEEAGQLLEAVEVARGKVKLPSRLQALRTILEVTGKVKGTADSIDALAAAIRGDLEKHGSAQL